MSTAVNLFVAGHPAPQGSKRHVGNGVMVESSKRVAPWRQDIREAFLLNGEPIVQFGPDQAVTVRLAFVMPRPKKLTAKRATPPHTSRPDVDKLLRAVLDALGSANIWGDDAQVVSQFALKRYAEPGETPGCHVQVQPYIELEPLW